MNKQILIIFFLILPLGYASTFDEFAQSYNYSYSNNGFNAADIELINCDICNNLTIKITTDSNPGNYKLIAVLDSKISTIDKYLFENDQTSFMFMPPFSKNDLKLELKVYDNILVYRNEFNVDLKYYEFTSPKVAVINDYLEDNKIIINISVSGFKPDKYYIRGYLENNDEIYISKKYINLTENILLDFDAGTDGNFKFTTLEIEDYIFNIDYTTSYYNLSRIIFKDDYIIDGDLVIEVNADANYYLFDQYSKFIADGIYENNKAAFNGGIINSSGLNGPYLIIAETEKFRYTYQTKDYAYNEFYDKAETSKKIDQDKKSSNEKSSFGGNIVEKIADYFIKENENKTISNKDDNLFESNNNLNNIKEFSFKQNEIANNSSISNLITGYAIGKSYAFVKNKAYLFSAMLIAIILLYYIRYKSKTSVIIYR